MPRLEPHLLGGLPLSVSMRRLDFDAGCPYHHALMAGTAQTSEPAPAPGEVDILFDLVRDRYGQRLTAEQLEEVRKGIERIVESARALRAVPLGNSDEPGQPFVPFRADR
jgi:hypothetical protein